MISLHFLAYCTPTSSSWGVGGGYGVLCPVVPPPISSRGSERREKCLHVRWCLIMSYLISKKYYLLIIINRSWLKLRRFGPMTLCRIQLCRADMRDDATLAMVYIVVLSFYLMPTILLKSQYYIFFRELKASALLFLYILCVASCYQTALVQWLKLLAWEVGDRVFEPLSVI